MRLPRRLRHGEEASLVDHLGELRARIVIALGSVAVGFAGSFVFHEQLIEWLRRPLPDDVELVTLGVTEPFFTAIKVSFYAAFALALPVLLYQLWSFLAPAMEESSQRIIAAFVVFSTVLFAGGLAFAYYIALPRAVTFLTNFDAELYEEQIRANYYFSFVSLTLLAISLVFELPIFILALVRLRVLTAEKLRNNRRIGYICVLSLAVLLPTVDPVSLAFEAIPLLVLFELSIWLAVFFERRWESEARRAAASAGEL